MNSKFRAILPYFAWLLIGIVFGSQLHLFASRTGGRMGWVDSMIWEVPRWMWWPFLAPVVRKLQLKYPLRGANRTKAIVNHSVFSLLLSLLHLLLFVSSFHLIHLAKGDHGKFFDTLQFAFPLDFHVGVAVYWLIILLKEHSDSQQRVTKLQAEVTHAQLQALRMQLHPHFLFNTLNSISSYLRSDVEIADEMIGRLGHFLRLTLQNPGTEEIVLEKELQFLKEYLAIEQARFQDRLHAEYEIEPATLQALVPNLILQPVVENAVRHGIAGSGTIRIAAKRLNGHLQIVIHDNGAGLPENVKKGIGLTATGDRLHRMYGADARVDLVNDPNGGTTVTLLIPFHTQNS